MKNTKGSRAEQAQQKKLSPSITVFRGVSVLLFTLHTSLKMLSTKCHLMWRWSRLFRTGSSSRLALKPNARVLATWNTAKLRRKVFPGGSDQRGSPSSRPWRHHGEFLTTHRMIGWRFFFEAVSLINTPFLLRDCCCQPNAKKVEWVKQVIHPVGTPGRERLLPSKQACKWSGFANDWWGKVLTLGLRAGRTLSTLTAHQRCPKYSRSVLE